MESPLENNLEKGQNVNGGIVSKKEEETSKH